MAEPPRVDSSGFIGDSSQRSKTALDAKGSDRDYAYPHKGHGNKQRRE